MDRLDNLYGNIEKDPEIRFDPFQMWEENGIVIGYQITIVPNRSNRPREQRPVFVNDPDEDRLLKSENVLMQIVKGQLPAFVVSDDSGFKSNPLCEDFQVSTADHSNSKAICVVNKFSIFSRISKHDRGIMVVAFPTVAFKFPRQNPKAVGHMLLSLKHAITGIQEHDPDKNLKLTCFMNIGANSGSSLVQLHAQAYIYANQKPNLGNVEYSFIKSYQYHKNQGICFACQHFNIEEHADAALNPKLIVWEDEYVVLKVAYAPIRAGQMRIIPKTHIKNLGEADEQTLMSLGKAISHADELMFSFIQMRSVRVGENDRSIAFRQTIEGDFHMIIDVFPVYAGFGGAELIIPLGISTVFPESFGESFHIID